MMDCHAGCRFFTTLLAVLTLSTVAYSQRALTVFDVDTSRFPIIRAKMFGFDEMGRRIANFDLSAATVRENNAPQQILSITCPIEESPSAISSVLAIDVSQSMGDDAWKMPIALEAARSWVNTMPLGMSECAITSFNSRSYLNQDFTTDRNALLDAINGLTTNGATDFDVAFLAPPGGALTVAQRGIHKRVVVLITDGIAAGTENLILQTAKADHITIYCITIGVETPPILKDLAEQTGGAWFEEVTSPQKASTIFQRILHESEHDLPCTISWKSSSLCSVRRDVLVSLENGVLADTLAYVAPLSSVPALSVDPAGLAFGAVAPPGFRTGLVKITAHGGDITINDLQLTDPHFTLVSSPSLPLVLKQDASIDVTVKFSATDSAYVYGQLRILSSACVKSVVHMTGGFPGHDRTLVITKPNGGEYYKTGMDTVITWSGVLPSDPVRLEYSTDRGSTWSLITPNASGLLYTWSPPNTPSSTCLVRGTQAIGSGTDTVAVLRFGHTAGIYAADFSPDERRVVTGSDDHLALVWDVATELPVLSLRGHTDWVRCVAYSPDGRWIVTGSYDGTAILYDASTGATVSTFAGHTGWILAVCFSPDSRYIATASKDMTARIWDVSTGKLVRIITGHNEAVTDVSFSPDGQKLVTASGDRTARIWNVADGTLFRKFAGHTDWVWSASFSRDAHYLLTSGDDRTARIWDVATGVAIHVLAQHTSSVRRARFSPDGSMVATVSDDGTGILWNASTGQSFRKLIGHQNLVRGLAFGSSGNSVVTASADTTARVWFLSPLVNNSDTSDRYFTIISPEITGPDTVDFGQVLVNRSKALTLPYLTSALPIPITVDDIRLAGNDAPNFSITSGFAPISLSPGQTHDLGLRFTPLTVGVKVTTVEIVTPRGTLRRVLIGEGIQPELATIDSIHFGTIICDDRHDTAIVIGNSGLTPLIIDSLQLTGDDSTAFLLTTRTGALSMPITLAPGSLDTIIVGFAPGRSGAFRTRLRISSNSHDTAITITASKDVMRFVLESSTVDFGSIVSGTSSKRTVRVTNTGTLPLTLQTPVVVGPFTIESVAPATLNPTGSGIMTIQFTAAVEDAAYDTTFFYAESSCGVGENMHFKGATDAAASVELYVPDITARPGEIVQIPVLLRNPNKLATAGVRGFSFRLRMRADLLIPIAPTPTGSKQGAERIIQVNAPLGPDLTLLSLPFRAAIGSESSTSIDIDGISSDGRNVAITETAGSFTLGDICLSGGARLLKSGDFGMKPARPNPVTSESRIDVTLVESGWTRIRLIDVSGREVLMLADAWMDPGTYSIPIDAARLDAGIYLCILQTPTERLTTQVVVVK